MNDYRLIPIEVGLKISIRDFVLDKLQSDQNIQSKFKLNIKRINRWWYSVYFDKLCSHDAEKLIFGDDIYCSDCRVKL